MAAFTSEDPTDREAFLERWDRIRADPGVVARSIVYGARVAGHILRFKQFEDPSVSYWLGRDFWGKGVATSALLRFLELVPERPLFARVAKDNRASLRVLRKCGFAEFGSDVAFAPGRGVDVEEVILRLGAKVT
jgi:RimJ/RimL family protein N-acetyltransferase